MASTGTGQGFWTPRFLPLGLCSLGALIIYFFIIIILVALDSSIRVVLLRYFVIEVTLTRIRILLLEEVRREVRDCAALLIAV